MTEAQHSAIPPGDYKFHLDLGEEPVTINDHIVSNKCCDTCTIYLFYYVLYIYSVTSITLPEDAHKGFMLQVYCSNTTEFTYKTEWKALDIRVLCCKFT